MALLPGGSLPPKGAKMGKIHEGGRDIYFIKDRIKVYFIYWIVAVLLIEMASVVLYYTQPNYDLFWFPLLTNLQFLVLLVAFLTHGKVLNFCKDKMWALRAFCGYYLFGTISIIFQLNSQIYVNISQGILLLVFVMFLVNLIKTYFNK